MTAHWASKYIGMEWVAGENDCWAFFRKVQADHFGIDVPAVDVNSISRLSCMREFGINGERENWESVQEPREGDAVLLGIGRRPSHIGLWANGGVLHCLEGAGVVHQQLAAMRRHNWNNIAFYRHLPCVQQ